MNALRRFKPYPAYKDSGVEWLGEVPAHWEVKRLKHLAALNPESLMEDTCIDPKCQIVQGKTVCVVTCQRSPEPVFLKWKGLETSTEGDFYVRSGPGTVKLPPDSAREYIRTRLAARAMESKTDGSPGWAV